jgi:regulator of replication initiation timing
VEGDFFMKSNGQSVHTNFIQNKFVEELIYENIRLMTENIKLSFENRRLKSDLSDYVYLIQVINANRFMKPLWEKGQSTYLN